MGVYTDHISVPGVAQRLSFGTLERQDALHLFNSKNKDLPHLFWGNNVGGPAIIFDRFQEAGESISSIRLNWVKNINYTFTYHKKTG